MTQPTFTYEQRQRASADLAERTIAKMRRGLHPSHVGTWLLRAVTILTVWNPVEEYRAGLYWCGVDAVAIDAAVLYILADKEPVDSLAGQLIAITARDNQEACSDQTAWARFLAEDTLTRRVLSWIGLPQ